MTRRPRTSRDTIVGRLKPADPFELIRWLARSQPDPRKALAELVQNSIDAGARKIRVTRLREHGVTALHVLDDGEGVIPGLDRIEALTYIATHIGHSLKRNLTPEQRRELMMQGKYGIGLLGFWAIGSTLEMRSQLPGKPAFLLRMFEDSPRFEIERMRSRLTLGERYTEVVIRALHRSASFSLTARRIADYLSAELRGQLLSREIEILVHDRIARGRAPKVLEVRPPRFEGERLVLPEEVATEDFSPVRVEIYLRPEGDAGERRVAVSCGGTIVYDDVAEFEAADFRRAPWTDARLSGLLEFPAFQVAPASRRGVVPDQAAASFAAAIRTLEPLLAEQLAIVERRAADELEAGLLRQLEKAFRDVPRLAPEYDFFAVRASKVEGATAPDPGAGGGGASSTPGGAAAGAALPEPSAEASGEPPSLLPAGTLHSLEIVPSKTRLERLGERRLRAALRDASGTRIRREITVRWGTNLPLGRVDPEEGSQTVFHAGPDAGAVTVVAEAAESGRSARGEAAVEIVDEIPGAEASRAGVPEPKFVDDPAASWRSRMSDGRWEVNSGHRDYRGAVETPRRKLRYLAALLAKEVVLHSFPIPQLSPALERLVEVLTITERRLERG